MSSSPNKKLYRDVSIFLLAVLSLYALVRWDPSLTSSLRSSYYGLPFETARDVKIASAWRKLRYQTLRLTCSDSGQLHLVLRARMPGPRDFVRPGFAPVTLFIDGVKGRIEMPARLVELGWTDTLVTSAITKEQIELLRMAYGSSAPRKVSVAIGTEMFVYLSGDGTGAEIQELSASCAPSKS